MNCKDCKHWQGHRYSEYADCYWVAAALEPELLECVDEKGYAFRPPFDPHYYHHWSIDPDFDRLYRSLLKLRVEMERGEIRVEKDKKLIYIQTRKDYRCKYFESNKTPTCCARST